MSQTKEKTNEEKYGAMVEALNNFYWDNSISPNETAARLDKFSAEVWRLAEYIRDNDPNLDRAAELPLERNTQHSNGGWISVKDALPENRVSRCVFNGRVRQMYYDPEREYWVDIRGEEHTDITHWMDLPDAPLS